jgi:hypothetical protein
LAKLTKSLFFKGQNPLHEDTSESATALALGRLAIKDFSNARVLERLLMYERRIEHSLYKTLIELQRLNLVKKLNAGSERPFNHLTNDLRTMNYELRTTNYEQRTMNYYSKQSQFAKCSNEHKL